MIIIEDNISDSEEVIIPNNNILTGFSMIMKNIFYIYGKNYSKNDIFRSIFFSILLMPIYISIAIFLVIRLAVLLILFTPFFAIRFFSGSTWGIDDQIMGIILLPLTGVYFITYYVTLIPFVILGLLADLIARIITSNHHKKYIMYFVAPFISPHIVMEDELRKKNKRY